MAVVSLTASALFSPLTAHAGTYTWTTTDANGNVTAQSPTFSGGQWSSAYDGGPFSYEGGNGGTETGDSSGQTSSSGELTATFTWQPAAGKTSTTDPAPTCVVKQTCSAYWTGRAPFDNQPSCSDGRGDPETDASSAGGYESGSSSGTHYRVEVPQNGTITETLTGAQASISPVNVYAGSFGSGVEWDVSIVNGNWDGPYYFHYGEKDDGVNDTPWANNTVGTTPSITDVSDSVSSFSLHNTAGGQAYVKGAITPVWYWNGPDLGVPPPPFEITVNTSASAHNNSGDATGAYALDGIDNNPHNIGSSGESDLGSEDVAVQVQSDEYAPGEGNGYWAIGPTVDLYASVFGNSPSDLESWVSLDASIESGLNN